jgi:hypothetical protein
VGVSNELWQKKVIRPLVAKAKDYAAARRDAFPVIHLPLSNPATEGALLPAYVQLDRLPEAQAALAKYKSLAPDMTISKLRSLLPFRYPAPLEMTLDGLRAAGLPG